MCKMVESSYEYDEKELDISKLKGVGDVTAKKLKDVGIFTIQDLLLYSPIYISEVTGIPAERAEKLVLQAYEYLKDIGLVPKDFTVANELFNKRRLRKYIKTGSNNFDEMMKGGIPTQAVTEFYGEFGSGKTQLCHSLAVNVQLPEDEGGLNKNAIYIDTENTFSPDRIVEIALNKGLDPNQVLRNIIVGKPYNTVILLNMVKKLSELIKKHNVGFIAIDSAVGPFRAEYLGRGRLSERQQLLNRFMHDLLRIAEVYDVAIAITNQVQARPDVMFGDPTRPIGGHVVAHAVTYRIYLKKAKAADLRVAAIVDSPEHPPREIIFRIWEGGVTDP